MRVAFGRDFAGTPVPGARYDYRIFYRDEAPDEAGLAGATVVWDDDVVRVYTHVPQ